MFGNPVEVMVKARVAEAEAKLKAIDLNHNGLSDVAEIQSLLNEGVNELFALESQFSPAEIAYAVNLLFPGKFSEENIKQIEATFGKLVNGFERLGKVAAAAPKAIGG